MEKVGQNCYLGQAGPITDSEAYLERLCRKSFLSLWSYARVFKDQPKHGAEVVDLLVVFGNNILLFSDKRCVFPDSGELKVDWPRWKRRAIEASAQQLSGAERWIRRFPNRIFLDQKCSKRLPIQLPPPEQQRFFRIVVANGVKARCIKELGGSGSLMQTSEADSNLIPFLVGQPKEAKGYVHVFDEASLDIIMRELDTISDFVRYLEKKEQLIQTKALFAAGEEELLAFYLRDINSDGEHDFIVPQYAGAISIGESWWHDFERSEARQSRIKADKASYAWDAIIEKFNIHAMTGTLHSQSPSGLDNYEKIVRFMAAEPRTRRRALIDSLLDLLGKTPANLRATRVFTCKEKGYPTYVFLLFPRLPDHNYDEQRKIRQQFLSACCRIAPLLNPDIREVIGLATETDDGNPLRSEDLVYIDGRDRSPEAIEEAKSLQHDLGLLRNVVLSEDKVSEYPAASGSPVVGSHKVEIAKKRLKELKRERQRRRQR